MAITIDDLVKELNPQDLWSLLFTLAEAAGLPVTAMQEIEAPRALITTFASWAATQYNNVIRRAIQAQYGDLVVDAGRTWATLWGLSLYGVAPDDAAFAEGPVVVTNTKGGVWSFSPNAFEIKNSTSGKRYKNVNSFSLAAWPGSGPFPTQTVTFRAVEAGSASTSAPTKIDTVVTGANGLTVSNAISLVGVDEESLTDFVDRARLTPALLTPNGPKDAYELILRRSYREDGSRIQVNRTKIRIPTGNGVVRCIAAGPSGALDPTDVTRLLQSLRSLAEPWGATVQVVSAANVLVPYNITAWAKARPNLSENDIRSAGIAALTEFLSASSTPIGGFNTDGGESGFIYDSELSAIVSQAHPEVYRTVTTGTDTAIGEEQVAVLGTGTISPVFV